MIAVIELMNLGYCFEVIEDPTPHIRYQAPNTLSKPILARFYLRRLQREREEAITFLRANRAAHRFAAVYECWCQDSDRARDREYVEELARIATAGGLPFYKDGIHDAGTMAWIEWANTFKEERVMK